MIHKLRNNTASLTNTLLQNATLKKIVVNTGWLSVERIFRLVISFFVGIWIARYLGPEQYGQLNYAQSFVALFSTMANLGLEGIVIRNIVNQPARKDELMGSAFGLKLVGTFCTIALTIGLIFFIRPGDTYSQLLVTIIALGMIFQSFDTIDYWFQSQVYAKVKVYANSISFSIISLGKVILILVNAPLIAFAYAGLAESLLGAIGLLVGYRVHGHFIRKWRMSLQCAKEMLKDSWPLILSSMAIMIYMRIDQIMIGEIAGDRELGIYSVAVRLGEMWYFIPLAIVSSSFPSIVQAKKISEELFYARLQNLYDVMAAIGFIAAIGTTFFATYIVQLFGPEYKESASLLVWYIWIGLFVNLGVARTSFLNTMNYTKWQFVTSLMGCVMNVLLNLVLIPRYGAMGATIASLFSYWFQTHGSCFFFRPMQKTGLMQTKAIFILFRIKEIRARFQNRSRGEYL